MQLALLWALLVVALLGCNSDRYCVRGDGFPQRETRIFETNFTEIDLRLAGRIFLSIDTSLTYNEIEVRAQDNILDEICTVVNNNRLEIDFQNCIKQHSDIEFTLRMNDLERIQLTGVGDVESTSLLLLDTLDIDISGSGDVSLILHTDRLNTTIEGAGNVFLEGLCEYHNFGINGGGDVNAFEFITDSVVASIQTTGRGRVQVEDFLEVNLNGIGDLLYRGEPTVINRFGTGSGQIVDDNL